MYVWFLFASCLFFSVVLIAKGNASNNFLMITYRKKGDEKSEEKVDKLEHEVLGVLSLRNRKEVKIMLRNHLLLSPRWSCVICSLL
jgi:hypothetical protein